MRLLTSMVLVVALVVCFGCAKKESAPADQPQSAAESQGDSAAIAAEDFESGEVESVVVDGDETEPAPQDDGTSH